MIEIQRKGFAVRFFFRVGALLGLVICFFGIAFSEKESQERFVSNVKAIVLFNSIDRGPYDVSISSIIKNILQNDAHVITNEQVEEIGLFQDVCENLQKQGDSNFVSKNQREQSFLCFKDALLYIENYLKQHKSVVQDNEKCLLGVQGPIEELERNLVSLEKFYIKGQKDRMVSELLADIQALFEFFYCYPRGGGYENSENFRCCLSFKSCEGFFEGFLSWIYKVFSCDLASKNPFLVTENKKLFDECIENFKKPENYCKKENLFLLRKSFCEALFHMPYHLALYASLLRENGEKNADYFSALLMLECFSRKIQKKFVSFFP